MITFKQFLNEEPVSASRTKGISLEEFKTWCDNNASRYLKGRKFLYRGGSGNGQSVFMLGDSNAGKPRKSVNTSNNYTLWLDNHPSFEGWPKRSRSFISTTNHAVAAGFHGGGDVAHLIIPADDALIGMVGKGDLWEVDIGFKIQFEDLSYGINDICEFMELPNDFETYAEMKKSLSAITMEKLEAKLKIKKPDYMVEKFYEAMKGTKADTMFDCLDKLVTPKLFDRSNGANISNRNVSGEVWIQGKCAFLPTGPSELSYNQRKEVLRWAEERGFRKFADTIQVFWEHKYDPDEEN